MVELNGNGYTVANKTDDTFELSGINGTGYTTYTSGGVAYLAIDGTGNTAYSSGGSARKAVTSVSGLDHLEGETISILGNGAVQADVAVASGAITLSPAASVVHAGYNYNSTVKTLRPEAGATDGTAQGKTQRVNEITVRFIDTLGGQVGPDTDNLDTLNFRSGSDPMDVSAPLFTGDKSIYLRGGWTTLGQVVVRQSQPLPMHITAIVTRLNVSDG